MIDVTEFVKELRGKVAWYPALRKHMTIPYSKSFKSRIVTNENMMTMCSTYYGRKYDMLSYREKRLVREDVFRKLRGEE